MARKVFHREVINCIVQKFGEKTNYNEFFKKFIELFPRKNVWNEELKNNDIFGKNWYPEGEVWLIKDLFEVDIDDEKSVITTEHWCDFYNELCENNW
jgi:hypothetical protein